MKAKISFDDAEPQAVFKIAHNLRGMFKTRQIEGQAKVNKEDRTLIVDAEIAREELEASLNSSDLYTKLRPTIEYQDQSQAPASSEAGHFPADYGLLKGQVKTLTEQMASYEAQAKRAELALADTRRQNQDLILKVSKLESECQEVGDVESFQQELMIRENRSWEGLMNWYAESLKAGEELTGISASNLAKACLHFKPTAETKEFRAIQDEYQKASAVRDMKKTNPYVVLDKKGEELLRLGDDMLERGTEIEMVREDIVNKFSKNRLTVAFTTEEEKALLTLPFKMGKRGEYQGMEASFLDMLDQNLSKIGLNRSLHNYHGFLRFVVEGAKTRKRNNLLNVLKEDKKDAFSVLGGKRQIIEFKVHE